MKLEKWSVMLYLSLSAIFYLIQNKIIERLEDKYTFFYSVFNIYIFHFLVTLVILSIIYLVSKKAPNFVGYTFMGSILFKMAAAVIFLIPLIKIEDFSKVPDFVSFFAPYFIFLFFEIAITLQFLKRSES